MLLKGLILAFIAFEVCQANYPGNTIYGLGKKRVDSELDLDERNRYSLGEIDNESLKTFSFRDKHYLDESNKLDDLSIYAPVPYGHYSYQPYGYGYQPLLRHTQKDNRRRKGGDTSLDALDWNRAQKRSLDKERDLSLNKRASASVEDLLYADNLPYGKY